MTNIQKYILSNFKAEMQEPDFFIGFRLIFQSDK